MPIRINLLAEQQAAEEMRRKDPVKRAVYAGGLLVVAMVAWIIVTQAQVIAARSELVNYNTRLEQVDEESKNVKNAQATVREIETKLKSLNKYSGSRFYWGTFLDAIQQIAADNVRLVEIRGEHNYRTNETAKLLTTNLVVNYTARPPGWKFWASAQASGPILTLVSNHFNTITNRLPFTTNEVPYTTKITPVSTNETEGLVTAKVEFTMVPSASEQITVQVRGRDYGNPPGAAIDEFARRLTSSSFFKEWLVRGEGIRFTERPPQPRPDPSDPSNPNALFVPFTIECNLKERVFSNE